MEQIKELLNTQNKPTGNPEPPAVRDVLDTIKDKNFGEFIIYDSANAWWTDVGKVKDLIRAFKNGCTVEQACVYIGISKDQYYYFLQIHPHFSYVKEACEVVADAVVLETAHKAARSNGKLAMMWLDKRGFFDKTKPKEPSLVQNNIQINNNNVVTQSKIEEAILKVVGAFRTAENQSDVGNSTESVAEGA